MDGPEACEADSTSAVSEALLKAVSSAEHDAAICAKMRRKTAHG